MCLTQELLFLLCPHTVFLVKESEGENSQDIRGKMKEQQRRGIVERKSGKGMCVWRGGQRVWKVKERGWRSQRELK